MLGQISEEIIRYLKKKEIDNKKVRSSGELSTMATTVTEMKIPVFVISWSLYNRLRIDSQLSSIKTMRRITLKVSIFNKTCFMSGVFKTVKENQKQCVIIQHEIYGGTLLGSDS